MRGFVVSEYLHPSKISVSSGVPEPKAAEDQVLVDVYSAGLNFFDVCTPENTIPKYLTHFQHTDFANSGKVPNQASPPICAWYGIRGENIKGFSHSKGMFL